MDKRVRFLVACGWGKVHFPKGTELGLDELLKKVTPEVLAVWRGKKAVEEFDPPPAEGS